jgi:hypothetical protein
MTAQEHLRRAESYLDDAQKRLAQGLPETADAYAVSLLRSADVAICRGESSLLAVKTRNAVDLIQRHPVSREASMAVWGLHGQVLLGDGKPHEALAALRPVFEDYVGKSNVHELSPRLLTSLLTSAARIGDADLTEEVARTMMLADDQMLSRKLAASAESTAQLMFSQYAERGALAVGHVLALLGDEVVPSWVYDIALNRKGVLAERQGLAWLRARGAGGSELFEEVRRLRAEVSRIDLDGADTNAIQSARRAYEEASSWLARAERALYREIGFPAMIPPVITTAQVQDAIESDTVLLDIFPTRDPDGTLRYTLFLVPPHGPVRFRDLGPAAEVNRRLEAFQALLGSLPKDAAQTEARAAELRRLAPQPFRPDEVLAQRILVAPTGHWGLVPPGLIVGPDGAPLLERHTVGLVPSARAMVARPVPSAASGEPVVIGDPDFDMGFDQEVPFLLPLRLPRLEHAAREVVDVATALGTRALVDAHATRERVLSVHRPRVLHLSTHGVFIDAISSLAEASEPRLTVIRSVGGVVVEEDQDIADSVLGVEITGRSKDVHRRRAEWLRAIGPTGQLSRSTLLLAGFNRWLSGLPTSPGVGTGMISAGELAMVDLAGTELVAMSACETGVGAVSFADGTLLGLRTAALAAGAASCLASLWKVDDELTSALMSAFYRHLATESTPEEALRKAQIEIRSLGSDPFFWAGWVLER